MRHQTRIAANEPIFQHALNYLFLKPTTYAALQTRGWELWGGNEPIGTRRSFSLRNYKLVSDGCVSATRAEEGSPEHLKEAMLSGHAPSVTTPPWIGEGADTLMLHINDITPQTGRDVFAFGHCALGPKLPPDPAIMVEDDVERSLGERPGIIIDDGGPLDGERVIVQESIYDAPGERGVEEFLAPDDDTQVFPYGSFGGTLHEPSDIHIGTQAPAGDVGGGSKKDVGKAPVWQGFVNYFPNAMEAVAYVSDYGFRKYGEWGGFAKVPNAVNRYNDAFARHQLAEARGEVYDTSESDLAHATQVAWNAMARLEMMIREGKVEVRRGAEIVDGKPILGTGRTVR